MQLIRTLMVAVAILTILSGLSTIFGSKKQNKSSAAWFFATTIGLAVWSISITAFLALQPGEENIARFWIVGVIAGITLADIGIIGYAGWRYKFGRVMLVLLSLVGVGVVWALAKNPEVFYSSVSLNSVCNKMEVVKGWYYITLIIYYGINTFTFLGFLLWTIAHTTNKNTKIGLKVFYVGLSICGVLSLVFDLLLLSTLPQFIWVGPMAISITMLCYYYSVVRYRVIVLTSRWMRIMSNMIMVVTGIIIYLILFYLVFMALFKIPNPSGAVLLLNFIMAAILLCLVPAISEISGFMKSMVTGQIDIGYITKNLVKLTGQKVSLKELAGFLSDHTHFSYIGILMGGRLYGSSQLAISADELAKIAKLKPAKRGVWQDLDVTVAKMASNLNLVAVAELKNSKGEQFGQVLIGKSIERNRSLDKKDLIQLEMIVNLTASVIESDKHIKA